ncbi:B1 protein-like [Zophobas morio]|uniref:B1 protein-like n=1 Tax=Zophobas morio TaxID=2755281 RepID=UPI003083465D
MMRLPFVILLFTTCTLAVLDESLSEIEPSILSCRSEHDVTDEEIQRDRAAGNFVNNPKYKEYILCILKKEGLIKESGELETEVITSRFQAVGMTDDQWALIFNCSANQATPEDTAIEFVKCINIHVGIFSGQA